MAAQRPRSSFAALVGGLMAYALVKLVAIGVMASMTFVMVMQNPQVFLPVVGAQLVSELIAAGIVLAVLAFLRFPHAMIFLAVAAVQLAFVWWHGLQAPTEAGMGWAIGKSGLDRVWEWLGQPVPYAEPTAMGGLTMPAILTCAAAGVVAQALHNVVIRDRDIH